MYMYKLYMPMQLLLYNYIIIPLYIIIQLRYVHTLAVLAADQS